MLNFIAPLNETSYGICGRQISKALAQRLGREFFLFPLHHINPQLESTEVQQGIVNSRFYNPLSPSIRLWHQHEMTFFVGKGERIGFPIFELTEFNPVEKHHLKNCDRLIVCSKWAKSIVEQNGIDIRCDVVPLGVDSSVFIPPTSKAKSGPTIFFCPGKFEKRKFHDRIGQIFNKAFGPKDNVLLFLLPFNPFLSDVEKSHFEKLLSFPKIRLLPRLTNVEDLVKMYQTVDCIVSPALAEGWNLMNLEAMSCGTHVITTNYSGHTEFCDKKNSLLIEPNGLEIAYDGKWFTSNCGSWMKFGQEQEDQLVEHMRTIHRKKQNGELELNTSGIDTAKEFSWNNSADKIIEIL